MKSMTDTVTRASWIESDNNPSPIAISKISSQAQPNPTFYLNKCNTSPNSIMFLLAQAEVGLSSSTIVFGRDDRFFLYLKTYISMFKSLIMSITLVYHKYLIKISKHLKNCISYKLVNWATRTSY